METLEISLNQNITKDFTTDLEFWMTNLPQKLRTLPIINLAIPGSHDSATYGITASSEIAPDAEPIIKRLQCLGPLLKVMMVKWGKTQTHSCLEQLHCGVRYLDLRIATRKNDDGFYFVHGVYANEVTKVFGEIKAFLEGHPKEVVILDCQHFYAFQQNDHVRLMYLLTSTFAHKLLPYTALLERISLQYMTDCRYQVILIYRSNAARFGQPLLWPSSSFPTPWADTVSIPNLISFLTDKLAQRNPNMGFISQCILTPTSGFIIRHLCSSLWDQCLLPLENEKYKWLKNQKPGRGGINIVISDFVEYLDMEFSRTVIGLNQQLLENETKGNMTPIDNTR